jgi:hypothetical protein
MFTLPGTCPIAPPTHISPTHGAVVDNPVTLRWSSSGPAVASLSVVYILTAGGQFRARYATADSSFSVPTIMSCGDYQWFVLTWNSTCGASVSGPASYTNSGSVPR